MSDNSSFDSEAASDDDSKEEEDTKSITERKKSSIKEIEIVPNIDLINAISRTLLTILNNNESLKNYREIVKKQNMMCFSANSVPNISIKDYLIRIQNYSQMEKSILKKNN